MYIENQKDSIESLNFGKKNDHPNRKMLKQDIAKIENIKENLISDHSEHDSEAESRKELA